MAGKRKTKGRVQQESLATPSRWRLQHGGFSEPIRDADPETGSPVQHRRAVDTLGMMLGNSTISQEMHDAGAAFRKLFRAAALDGLAWHAAAARARRQRRSPHRAASRVAGARGGGAGRAGRPRQRGRLLRWHVLGLEMSVREWAQRQGWGGRSVPASQAQGMLVAALGVLAAHFGLTDRRRAA